MKKMKDEYDFITVCNKTIGYKLSSNNCDKFDVLQNLYTSSTMDGRYV